MGNMKNRRRPSMQKPKKEHQELPNESSKTEYEEMRQERIKENLARMKQMGILELSKKLSDESHKPRAYHKKIYLLTRRSSRLNTITRVNYGENKAGRAARNTEIHIQQGSEPEIYTPEHEKLLGDCKTKWALSCSEPEIYTPEHEKLLGDCKTKWALYVDVCDKNGKKIYDPVEGKGCHQCRQKTLGRHTQCSSCNTGQGQFCGDCLFTRYGENVIEVNKNPSWICPVCRGICNCSRCRLSKGRKPTGSIYTKVKRLGFKSVAHYLIQSRPAQTIQEEPTKENPDPQNGLLPTASVESEPTNGISNPQSNYTGSEEIEEDIDLGSINGGTYNQDGNIEDYDTVDSNEKK